MVSQSSKLKAIQYDSIAIWLDNTLIQEDCDECFSIEYWQSKDCIIGSAIGRGTTWFVQLQHTQGALRHYHRGGLFGKFVADYYWFTGWEKTRSYQEFVLLNYLREAGVNVPRPIAARVQKNGFFYKADLLSEKVCNARDLLTILQEQIISVQLYRKIGREIRKMHDARVNHTDLNIHNILVDEQETVWIIDFDKCYVEVSRNWQSSNLERLKRSFIKEVVKRSIKWCELDWQSLKQGYQAGD
ncbi:MULTISPECIES: 3-deoxy-D-manno-octulosonic acid kinase [Vibrio]|uniref:3-deoxy-D-manno-octulosonic acid kinase n=1 Tax=Vibrio TaxID=662 RepID=UPI0006467B46|nr:MULTISPECIES: 3-deoxy-D-manno-octulosonic acid kinase [Vibrio]MBY7668151.1 3-deoxy-D-manno-octulosonic acid kinase [Vibrio anguillarum]NAX43917.1 3-deoxy-D-manno-octulosonic acid kinase [Vibrio sp. V25_P4S6T154]OXX47708.1 3-deoxy-D-manno-octulosonic acid kinase [Vibrio sp. V17_P4S1T151]OXX61403.1 3-deoxy-D-manno-octulosonic acid kinase [Vibrio sp. V15_P4S5T153]OXX67037.1 3-deoxy-D-manno-octulosonic acid kinase [Vibrio sp. V20_P4S3T152]